MLVFIQDCKMFGNIYRRETLPTHTLTRHVAGDGGAPDAFPSSPAVLLGGGPRHVLKIMSDFPNARRSAAIWQIDALMKLYQVSAMPPLHTGT
jgi:hypothetical protein